MELKGDADVLKITRRTTRRSWPPRLHQDNPIFHVSRRALRESSRPRHHALEGTFFAPSPVHSFELANLQDDSKVAHACLCVSVVWVPMKLCLFPRTSRSAIACRRKATQPTVWTRASTRLAYACGACGRWRRLATTLPFAAPRCGTRSSQPRRPRSARQGLRGHRAAHVPVLRRGR